MNFNQELKPYDINLKFVLSITFYHILLWFLIGFIGSFIFNLPIYMGYLVYLISGTVSWIIHMIGHTRLIGFWYNSHTIGHHIKAYPAKKFLSKTYVKNKYDKYNLNVYMYSIGGIITIYCFKLILALNFLQTSGITIYILSLLLMESWIHDQFHLENSCLNNYTWFRKMQWIHYLHHQNDMKRNYAMKDFFIDFMAGTLVTN